MAERRPSGRRERVPARRTRAGSDGARSAPASAGRAEAGDDREGADDGDGGDAPLGRWLLIGLGVPLVAGALVFVIVALVISGRRPPAPRPDVGSASAPAGGGGTAEVAPETGRDPGDDPASDPEVRTEAAAVDQLEGLLAEGRFREAASLIEARRGALPSNAEARLREKMEGEFRVFHDMASRYFAAGDAPAGQETAEKAAARFPDGAHRTALLELARLGGLPPAARPTPEGSSATERTPPPAQPAAGGTPAVVAPTPGAARTTVDLLKERIDALLAAPSVANAQLVSSMISTPETRRPVRERWRQIEPLITVETETQLALAILTIIDRAELDASLSRLRELAAGEDEEVARRAIALARRFLAHEQDDWLRALLRDGEAPRIVRVAAARALAERDDDSGKDVILAALAGPFASTGLLEDALQSAAILRLLDAVDPLSDMLTDADPFVRQAAETTIGRIVTARFLFREILPSDFGYDAQSTDADTQQRAVRAWKKGWRKVVKARGRSFVPQIRTDAAQGAERPSGTRWGPGIR